MPFGDQGVRAGFAADGSPLAAAPLLFEIPSSALGGSINQVENKVVTLQIRETTTNGDAIGPEPIALRLPKVVRYTHTNRFGIRDIGDCTGLLDETRDDRKWRDRPFPCGGDDWALPKVKTWAERVAGVNWNDFSNMNAGSFPYHRWHNRGDTIDGQFGGYDDMDAGGAQRMIDYLNTYGLQIERAYVSFALRLDTLGRIIRPHGAVPLRDLLDPQKTPATKYPYWDAIRSVRLKDGRRARDVIRNIVGHHVHFDWLIRPERPLPTGTDGTCQ